MPIKPPEVFGEIRLGTLTELQFQTLKRVLEANPLYAHGIHNGDPKLYRLLCILRSKGLVRREGYKYYPTKYGWLQFMQVKDQLAKAEKTQQADITGFI